MNKEAKYDLAMMQSLMERMDKHLTLNESNNLKENLLKEHGINEAASSWRYVAGPDEFYDILTDVSDGRRVTFGYVSAAKIAVPKGKRLNPATNRMNQFDDYEQLGKNLGVNGTLSGVIKLSVYNFPWQTAEKVNGQYSDFKKTRDALAQKYNIEVGKARYGTQTMNMGDKGGISSYNGQNQDNAGHTYTNINTYGIKPINTTYYLVMSDGKIEPIDVQRLELLPYKASETIIDKLKNAGATQDEIEPLLKMNYQRFEHSHILYFSATPDSGIPSVFINSKLSDKIAGITLASTDEIINLAKERYSKFINNNNF